jgi:hypothetical protein
VPERRTAGHQTPCAFHGAKRRFRDRRYRLSCEF